MTNSPTAKTEDLLFGGALVKGIPGLYNLAGGGIPFLITTSELAWHSTTTQTSRKVVPFNYKLIDYWTRLITAPVGNSGKFRVGTSTSVSLFFGTGTLSFNSNSVTGSSATSGFTRRTSATNFVSAQAVLGTAGQLIQMQVARKGAGAFSTKGAVIGLFAVIPR